MVTLILCCVLAITDKTYLFVANYCASCREAEKIIEKLDVDIEIININKNKDLVKKYEITTVPTLIVNNNKIEGLQSEEAYRKLLTKKFNYTGIINFTNDKASYCPVYARIVKFAKLSKYNYTELDPDENPMTVLRYKIKKIPTLLLLNNGEEIGRYTGVTVHRSKVPYKH